MYIGNTGKAFRRFVEMKSNYTEEGKVKISLLQAVEAHRVVRGQGSHIT
jgi:hypothetical protein